ncbi:ClbS/DfsB family four-helix bundle protein [Denitrobaculum tricleocarpae]|uniref:ClbS/DfsB family four-helix bundle protein n=1 Tax=Denitrobaculum tricleocarpae TaxID=2591009 RepID=A0A545TRF8_9PROT|nr:ClbS/DfsB family four-helix bundle protein [Denitrobaculum tricleocarpae]TQV79804.1 ClbS/DfsB family four-helix bundle protein [Denitrobaculum tricleocarpae]
MAATNKTALLEISGKEYGKLASLLEQVGEDLALVKDAEETSIKDVVGHRAHWIALFLGWYADGQAGKKVFFPAEGYKWNELKRYNAALRAEQAGLGWQAACRLLAGNHAKLTGFIEGHSDQDLYGGPMKGANNLWTTGRWAEAAGPSHYRSAAKYIRQRLKDQRD